MTPPPSPPQDDTAATKKYKGVHFGNLKSLRTQFKGKPSGEVCRLMYMYIPAPTTGKDGPGPGDYDLCQDSGRNSPAKVQSVCSSQLCSKHLREPNCFTCMC